MQPSKSTRSTKGPSIFRRMVRIESHKICVPLPLVSTGPNETRHVTHTRCSRIIQIRRGITIQKTVFTVILPKWDIVTNNVIYPLIWPSKAICNIASRFLPPNLFLTLVLIKFCTQQTCSHVVVETHCTQANSARTKRSGYHACKV
jgi:hypothetical protein